MAGRVQAPEVFMTERLRLRPATDDDAPKIFSGWAQDKEVTRFLTWRPHVELADAEDHVARCKEGWANGSPLVWMLENLETGELAGSVAARPRKHGVNLGYLLGRDYWGRGLMVEALNPVVEWWLGQEDVFRVWATTDVENDASRRVLEKLGFVFEGVLRRWEVHPNLSEHPRDAACYSRVKRLKRADTESGNTA